MHYRQGLYEAQRWFYTFPREYTCTAPDPCLCDAQFRRERGQRIRVHACLCAGQFRRERSQRTRAGRWTAGSWSCRAARGQSPLLPHHLVRSRPRPGCHADVHVSDGAV